MEAIWMTVAPKPARRALLLWATGIGMALVVVGWRWCPERMFQAVMLGRQYATLLVALTGTAALVYVRWIRRMTSVLDGWWVAWVWTLTALAITTKGGLLWSVAEWKGGMETWREVCDGALLAEMALVGWRMLSRIGGQNDQGGKRKKFTPRSGEEQGRIC